MKAIGEGCFSDCSSLTELNLPEGLETIGEGAFQNAEGVKFVSIPRSVRTIGVNAFYFGDAGRLLAIHVNPENPAYCDLDGVLYTKDRTALVRYPAARRRAEYIVPDPVTRICDGAFAHSHYLLHIILPDGLRILESSAFSFCTQLEELDIPEAVDGIPSYAFFCCKKLRRLRLPGAPEGPPEHRGPSKDYGLCTIESKNAI